jgi:hypothetical protein
MSLSHSRMSRSRSLTSRSRSRMSRSDRRASRRGGVACAGACPSCGRIGTTAAAAPMTASGRGAAPYTGHASSGRIAAGRFASAKHSPRHPGTSVTALAVTFCPD